MKNLKYFVTFSIMILVIFGMYTLHKNSIILLRDEINKNELLIMNNDSLLKFKVSKQISSDKEEKKFEEILTEINKKFEKNDVNMEELVIDKYIDYTSYLVAGIAVIMTVMILFTFRDFERLDQLKEQYINEIEDLKNIKSDVDAQFKSFEGLQTKYINELNKNKDEIKKDIDDEIKKFVRIGNYNKIRLQKAHDQVMELGVDLKNQGEFINTIIDSIGTQGIESLVQLLFRKDLITKDDLISEKLNISKILIDSPRTDIKMRAILNIRNSGSSKDFTFLKEKLNQEKDENIRKALIDAMTDLLKK